jgi:hypothetical protein
MIMHTYVHDEHFYGMIAVSVEVCTRKYFHTRYVHMASVRTSMAAVAVLALAARKGTSRK